MPISQVEKVQISLRQHHKCLLADMNDTSMLLLSFFSAAEGQLPDSSERICIKYWLSATGKFNPCAKIAYCDEFISKKTAFTKSNIQAGTD